VTCNKQSLTNKEDSKSYFSFFLANERYETKLFHMFYSKNQVIFKNSSVFWNQKDLESNSSSRVKANLLCFNKRPYIYISLNLDWKYWEQEMKNISNVLVITQKIENLCIIAARQNRKNIWLNQFLWSDVFPLQNNINLYEWKK